MVNRKIIRIDEDLCDGCGQCITACAEGALALIDGKAKVVKESFCDGLGACIGECPTGALTIEEREAEEFDEEAVMENLDRLKSQTSKEHVHSSNGEICCPSARPESFRREIHSIEADSGRVAESMLEHWPVQLMLVPENAPFLKDKELVVLADCAAVAYANLHREFLHGKAVVMGCPKFDKVDIYKNKLVGMIKKSGVKSISVVHMEVPCCFGLELVVSEAIAESGMTLPYNRYVIGIRGEKKIES